MSPITRTVGRYIIRAVNHAAINDPVIGIRQIILDIRVTTDMATQDSGAMEVMGTMALMTITAGTVTMEAAGIVAIAVEDMAGTMEAEGIVVEETEVEVETVGVVAIRSMDGIDWTNWLYVFQ